MPAEFTYDYAVVAVETSTCKNGKKQSVAHHATFTEPGAQWPDQLGELLKEKLGFEWALEGSNVCAGTREVAWSLPSEPFETDELRKAWLADRLAEFQTQTAGFSKVQVRAHEAFGL